MSAAVAITVVASAVVVAVFLFGSAVRVVKQYERGVHFGSAG